ncbi:hypothetical protein ACFW1A_13770 [Kitasatospora sp. NPDC058965]|uniref:hypothetical protein n=1 Tax=Kitasatospora sp. NPDC058965 TaxID=3346682 RepID=UPI00367B5EC1
MTEKAHSIGEGPAVRGGLPLPEGTAEAICQRVGEREFSTSTTATVERDLRGRILDEYLADYERRHGSISAAELDRARHVFDEVFDEEGGRPVAR